MTSATLPPEIILEIIRKVDRVESTPAAQIARVATLAALSRACKDFYTFTEPYLYSRIEQISEDGKELPLLLRTLLRKPCLGHFVKTFVGTCFRMNGIDMRPFRDLYSQLVSAGDWLLAMPTEWCPADFERRLDDIGSWATKMQHGDWDALTALLLCFLPNIEKFNLLGYTSVIGHPFITALFGRAIWLQNHPGSDRHSYEEHPEFKKVMQIWKSVPRMEDLDFGMANLRQVNIGFNNIKGYPLRGIFVRHVFRFIALKSVKIFSGHMMVGSQIPIPVLDLQITDLAIHHTAFVSGVSEPFLASFKRLKRLVCNMTHNFPIPDQQLAGFYEIDPPRVSGAIAHLSDSLEEISLTQETCRDVVANPGAYFPLESLASFGKLRKLEASAHVLLGRRPNIHGNQGAPDDIVPPYQPQRIQHILNMFPESLESLSIVHCDPAIFGAITPFLVSRSGAPRKLVSINLEFRPDLVVQPSAREWSTCQQLALKYGIKIKTFPANKIRSCSSCDYSSELYQFHEARR